MNKQPILFIVGAGASIPYGYPTGAGLLAEILADKTISAELKELLEFNEPFSIDVFLAQHCGDNPALTLEAKKLIVKHILLKEDRSKIYQKNANGWYHFLWNMLCNKLMDIVKKPKDERLAALKEDFDIPFRVITFNYDVSLDYYLLSRIWRANMLEVEEKKELLKKMRDAIVHVYGSVRDVPWDNPEWTESEEKKVDLNNKKYPTLILKSINLIDNQKNVDYAYGGLEYFYVDEKHNLDCKLTKHSCLNYHKYIDSDLGQNFITDVAKNKIKVINYERDGDIEIEEKLKPFHEVIANTSNIIFLGFGFDDDNMKLLFPEEIRIALIKDIACDVQQKEKIAKKFFSNDLEKTETILRNIPTKIKIQHTNYENSEKINRKLNKYFYQTITSNKFIKIISARKVDNAIQQALAHDFDLQ
jgi:hypothetical protein